MQEETTTKAQEQEKTEAKRKTPLGKSQVAMLSVAATVLIFILAFSCYGCSYQPITPPTNEEAKMTFANLYSSTWVLDTAAGKPTPFPEMPKMVIEQLTIGKKQEAYEGASVVISIEGIPDIHAELTYKEEYGFIMKGGSTTFPVKLLYSTSKDGKSETLTMIGNQSNERCYYLKK